MAAGKSEVVSVCVESHIKTAAQAPSYREIRCLARIEEVMVVAYCRSNDVPSAQLFRQGTAERHRLQIQ